MPPVLSRRDGEEAEGRMAGGGNSSSRSALQKLWQQPKSSLVSLFLAPIRAVDAFHNTTTSKVKLDPFILSPSLWESCWRTSLKSRAVAEFPSSRCSWPGCVICFWF